jgi:hypothetical protein
VGVGGAAAAAEDVEAVGVEEGGHLVGEAVGRVALGVVELDELSGGEGAAVRLQLAVARH